MCVCRCRCVCVCVCLFLEYRRVKENRRQIARTRPHNYRRNSLFSLWCSLCKNVSRNVAVWGRCLVDVWPMFSRCLADV